MGLKGNTNEEKIWNYLMEKLQNSIIVSAFMGNMFAESGLNANNLENTYNNILKMSDAEYTSAVDMGSYINFIHDSAGYGLAQWTFWTRKQGLYNLVKQRNVSIADLETQLDFLYQELKTNYNSLLVVLQRTTSLKEASDLVLARFENPRNQGESVKQLRYEYSLKYYNKFHKEEEKKVVETPKPQTNNKVKFTIRTTAPNIGDKYYTNTEYGGLNTCIVCGTAGFVLPNCVGYAHGRVLEATGATAVNWKLPAYHAEDWLDIARKNGMEVGTYPKAGSVVVWSKGQKYNTNDGAGHVAFIEQINNDGTMLISESGYKSFVFRTRTIPIDYVPNGYSLEGYIYPECASDNTVIPSSKPVEKSIEQLAKEVIEGKWGNGKTRKERLTFAGYNYADVQKMVDKMLIPTFKPYLVRVKANVLNVRTKPSTENGSVVVAQIIDKGIYTIVDEKNNFGKLKSGNGWISLDWVDKI